MLNPYHFLAQQFSFISPTIYKSRFYKNLILLNKENIFERNVEPEMLWLKDFLSQKDVFLDIGTGTGNYIYYLDYILFPENIYAFEPNKKLYKKLKNLFSKTNFYPIALSDNDKETLLYLPVIDKEELYEKGTLQPISPDTEDTKIITQKVKTQRLDDWAKENEIERIDFIKIDVIGQELLVLKGAEETIKKFRPTLMIKIEPSHHKQDIWQIISEIEIQLGYSAHYIHREEFTLKPLTKEILTQQNTIFAENDSRYIRNIIFINNYI